METLTSNVVLDIVAILEEVADTGRLVGSEDTTIESVTSDGKYLTITLDNGDRYDITVRPS